MGKIISLDERRPHITMTTHSGAVHVIPASVFVDIAKGRKSVDCLSFRDDLMRLVVAEWLHHIGLSDAEALREMEDQDGAS